jgi:hypothetical protein
VNTTEVKRLNTATDLLRQAQQLLGPSSDGLVCAVSALVDCASEVAYAAAAGDADAAREALACARAAVVAATYASRTLAGMCRMSAYADRALAEAAPGAAGGPRQIADAGSPAETSPPILLLNHRPAAQPRGNDVRI